LELVTRTLIHFEHDDSVDLSRNFNRISNLLSFDNQVLRGGGRIRLEKEAAALFQSAFGCPGEMPYIKTGIGPDGSRREGPPIRISKEDQRASHTFEQRALEGKPTLAEGLGGRSLGKLAPEVLIEVGTLTVSRFAYFKTGARSISEV
jgi:hypothetical protein